MSPAAAMGLDFPRLAEQTSETRFRCPGFDEMAEHTRKIFSLAEANELVPEVAEWTAQVVQRLEEIRSRHADAEGREGDFTSEGVIGEIDEALTDWSNRIVDLGALPKGYFTVDFQSPDPELLYCWTYGEERIGFTHKVWENFAHRRPLGEGLMDADGHARWVH